MSFWPGGPRARVAVAMCDCGIFCSVVLFGFVLLALVVCSTCVPHSLLAEVCWYWAPATRRRDRHSWLAPPSSDTSVECMGLVKFYLVTFPQADLACVSLVGTL